MQRFVALAAAGASHNDVWMLYAEPWRREVKALLDQVPWRFAEKQTVLLAVGIDLSNSHLR